MDAPNISFREGSAHLPCLCEPIQVFFTPAFSRSPYPIFIGQNCRTYGLESEFGSTTPNEFAYMRNFPPPISPALPATEIDFESLHF